MRCYTNKMMTRGAPIGKDAFLLFPATTSLFFLQLLFRIFYPAIFIIMSRWLYLHLFIHKVSLARRQQRDLLFFKSSCHQPTFLPHTVEASHCFIAERQAWKFCTPICVIFSLTWNRTQMNSFSS